MPEVIRIRVGVSDSPTLRLGVVARSSQCLLGEAGALASHEHLADEFAVNVCQPKVATLKPEDQFFMIDAKQVQDRRVNVVDVTAILGGIEA